MIVFLLNAVAMVVYLFFKSHDWRERSMFVQCKGYFLLKLNLKLFGTRETGVWPDVLAM